MDVGPRDLPTAPAWTRWPGGPRLRSADLHRAPGGTRPKATRSFPHLPRHPRARDAVARSRRAGLESTLFAPRHGSNTSRHVGSTPPARARDRRVALPRLRWPARAHPSAHSSRAVVRQILARLGLATEPPAHPPTTAPCVRIPAGHPLGTTVRSVATPHVAPQLVGSDLVTGDVGEQRRDLLLARSRRARAPAAALHPRGCSPAGSLRLVPGPAGLRVARLAPGAPQCVR